MSQATNPTPSQPTEPERPRSNWEKVITSTPILLTIVATLLAGMSSSEMTRAQYYRAVAAQNQSKVSDQWNFFQAKKVRGTAMEGTATVLRSTTGAGKLTTQSLVLASQRLTKQCENAKTEAKELVKKVSDAGSAAQSVRSPADQFLKAAEDAFKASDAVRSKLDALAKQTPESSLTLLTVGSVPERLKPPDSDEVRKEAAAKRKEKREKLDKILAAIPPKKPDEDSKDSGNQSSSQSDAAPSKIAKQPPLPLGYFDLDLLEVLHTKNSAILLALWQVDERKTEDEMTDSMPKITENQIHEGIVEAEKTARLFEDRCEPITGDIRDLDKLIADQTNAARAVYRSSQEVNQEAAVASGGDPKLASVQLAAVAASRTGSLLKLSAEELGTDFKAAQLIFDTRRYSQEANDNRAVAGLYELNVRKASLESDRHRHRSSNFFYAMLAAQGGVTIATFSIAMRKRSFLWGLATAAGLAAITFGSYVFLTM